MRVVVRPKYKKILPADETNDTDKTEIVIADAPSRPIAGSYAGASLLKGITIDKLVDHLPFDRQIKRFQRDFGLQIPSSTINSWFVAVCTLLQPLYQELRRQTLAADYLQADESRIEVLTTVNRDKNGKKLNKRQLKPKNTPKIRRGWMWVVYDPVRRTVVFNFERGRGKADANELLSDYAGYLQVDGYASYEHLLARPAVTYVACTAHVRRKFFDALKNDRKRAEYALDLFRKMYALEAKARETGMNQTERLAYRLTHLHPLLTEFKTWLDEESVKVTPKSAIGKAMTYAQTRWEGLKNLLTDGRLELDNNLIENQIRPLALGRKNYLFAGSDEGAQRLAMLYSLLGTCKARGVNPRDWLQAVLERLPNAKITELEKLLPGNFEI